MSLGFLGICRDVPRTGEAMSFGIYAIGFGILICGLVYGAYLLHIPAHWIVVGAVVLLGIGILSGVKATRQKDPVG
jgi:sulfite exporter TauE/SafE